MKRNLIIGLPLVVFSLLLTTASAYSQSKSKAYVPFAFKAGQARRLYQSASDGASRRASVTSAAVKGFMGLRASTTRPMA